MDREHTRYWKRRPARAANELTIMRAQLTRVHEFARIMEKKNGTKPKEEVKENAYVACMRANKMLISVDAIVLL